LEIANLYKDSRRKVLSDGINIGLVWRLNKIINLANGHYLDRMDSDDVMHEERLQKQYKYLQENPEVDILGGQIFIPTWTTTTAHPPIITKSFAAHSTWFINHPTVMFKKDRIISIGAYKDTPEYFAEDYDLWLRALTEGLQIHNLHDIIVYYRVHENNLSKTTEKNVNLHVLLEKMRLEFIRKNDLS
jgi:glycosyltransferase involved in cell wall biosynthesis